MKSPFPGMDPYLERHWRDVHHRLITYASDTIAAALPRDLCARVEERILIDVSMKSRRGVYPDARVVETAGVAEAA